MLLSVFRVARKGWTRYRRKGKSLTLALSGVFFLLVLFLSLFSTLRQNLWDYWVEGFVGGHLITAGSVEDYDLFHPLPPEDYFSYREFLAANPSLAGMVAPHLKTGALLENRETQDAIDCIITSIDLAQETGLNDHIKIKRGRFFTPGTKEIILPENIAVALGVELGDEVTVFLLTEQGYFNYDLLTIVGFVDLSLAASYFGLFRSFVPIDTLRELMFCGEDTVSELLYVPGGRGSLSGFGRPGYRMINGIESFAQVRAFSWAFKFLEFIFSFLILSFAVTVVYHNVVLINEERTAEIGVYLTYGASPSWIKTLMFMENMLNTAYCALWGGAAGWFCLRGINNLGLYPVDAAMEILMATSHFTLRSGWDLFLKAFLILLFLAGLGSYRPIWRVAESRRVVGLFTHIHG